jgi:phosphoribosylglycinamide formyltransferase-1
MTPLPIGVLVSGTGTNLQAIIDAIAQKRLDATIKVVISNKRGVLALDRAADAGVATRVVSHRDYPTREAFDDALAGVLRESGAEWVVLAGFMRLLTRRLISAYPNRIVNIHPALLPAFPGVDAQEQAFAYGVKFTGCTVHFVDEGTDTGPIIAQRVVPVLDTDDPQALRARILSQEHALLVESLQAIAEGRVEVIAPPAAGSARTRVRTRPA